VSTPTVPNRVVGRIVRISLIVRAAIDTLQQDSMETLEIKLILRLHGHEPHVLPLHASAVVPASWYCSCWISRTVAQTAPESVGPRVLDRATLAPENESRRQLPSRSATTADWLCTPELVRARTSCVLLPGNDPLGISMNLPVQRCCVIGWSRLQDGVREGIVFEDIDRRAPRLLGKTPG
jgi:hypothetical protein